MTGKFKTAYQQLNELIKRNKLEALRGVFIFSLITIGFHFLFKAFAIKIMNTWPVPSIADFTVELLFKNSLWFNTKVLGMNITTVDTTLFFPDCGFIHINHSCSAIKQFMQWIVLMLLYPGPWKHKLWYIPLGIVILHFTNIFRIVGLSIVLLEWPAYWDWSHDWFFRPFFYVVIFIMWVIWAEYFPGKREIKKQEKG